MSKLRRFKFTSTDLIISITVPLLILGGLLFWANINTPDSETCYVNPELEVITLNSESSNFNAEIAKTSQQKQMGLSNRNCIDSNQAMIFPYELTGDYCFWMKDMNFSIDMVWLDEDKKIINFSPDVSPETYPNTFCPERPARYILEFKAGTVVEKNWQSGTEFSFNL